MIYIGVNGDTDHGSQPASFFIRWYNKNTVYHNLYGFNISKYIASTILLLKYNKEYTTGTTVSDNTITGDIVPELNYINYKYDSTFKIINITYTSEPESGTNIFSKNVMQDSLQNGYFTYNPILSGAIIDEFDITSGLSSVYKKYWTDKAQTQEGNLSSKQVYFSKYNKLPSKPKNVTYQVYLTDYTKPIFNNILVNSSYISGTNIFPYTDVAWKSVQDFCFNKFLQMLNTNYLKSIGFITPKYKNQQISGDNMNDYKHLISSSVKEDTNLANRNGLTLPFGTFSPAQLAKTTPPIYFAPDYVTAADYVNVPEVRFTTNDLTATKQLELKSFNNDNNILFIDYSTLPNYKRLFIVNF